MCVDPTRRELDEIARRFGVFEDVGIKRYRVEMERKEWNLKRSSRLRDLSFTPDPWSEGEGGAPDPFSDPTPRR